MAIKSEVTIKYRILESTAEVENVFNSLKPEDRIFNAIRTVDIDTFQPAIYFQCSVKNKLDHGRTILLSYGCYLEHLIDVESVLKNKQLTEFLYGIKEDQKNELIT